LLIKRQLQDKGHYSESFIFGVMPVFDSKLLITSIKGDFKTIKAINLKLEILDYNEKAVVR
jgi:hypothetical protein